MAADATYRVEVSPREIPPGGVFTLTLAPVDPPGLDEHWVTAWLTDAKGEFQLVDRDGVLTTDGYLITFGTRVQWTPDQGTTGRVTFNAWLYTHSKRRSEFAELRSQVLDRKWTPNEWTATTHGTGTVAAAPALPAPPTPVTLTRAHQPMTTDEALWVVIRDRTEALSFDRYRAFVDNLLCLDADTQQKQDRFSALASLRSLPFPDVDPYRLLKVATELFLRLYCGVHLEEPGTSIDWDAIDLTEEGIRLNLDAVRSDALRNLWARYVDRHVGGVLTIPYLELVAGNLEGLPIDHGSTDPAVIRVCQGIIRDKLTRPCFMELIWSYWHEEGMLVQTMKAVAWRFQNRRAPVGRDPLALLEIDPLRRLNSLIWGYVEDEQHRLTVARRAYEYDHEYGITLLGRAVPEVRGADPRSRFVEAFHNLLYLCSIFYKESDDTTVIADGFPVLNALKEVHLLLTQGAHNQYGDLPWMARQEMLMEQWILARPEFREFLPRRVMVGYPEAWMHSVETMKGLQGWTDTSILHFRDLGRYGERILLSARFRDWTRESQPAAAANWASYWRAEIQGYLHAYRAVTGIDMTERVDTTMPGVLLRQRLPRRAAIPDAGRPPALPPAGRWSVPRPAAAELAEWTERD